MIDSVDLEFDGGNGNEKELATSKGNPDNVPIEIQCEIEHKNKLVASMMNNPISA